MNFTRRRTLAAAFFVVAGAIAARPAPAHGQAPDQVASVDFARLVPGDADFFVEVSKLRDLQQSFQSLGVWQALRDTVEGDKATTQPWQRRSEQLLGMSSEQMVVRVLGHRAALFAKQSDDWQNGVLIAEFESRVALRTLLQDWRARELPKDGPVRRYQLRGNLRCAVLDRILILGPPDDPEGLWGRSVLLLTGRGPHLAGQSEFASLRSRLKDAPDALLFARWPKEYAYAFAGCERILVTMKFESIQTTCNIYGRRRTPRQDDVAIDSALLERASEEAVAVWAGALDDDDAAADPSLAPSGPGALLHQLLGRLPNWRGTQASLLRSAEHGVLLQLGTSPSGDFQFPTLCLTLQSKDASNVAQQFDDLFVLLAQLIAYFATPRGEAFEMPSIEHQTHGDADVRRIDLGRLLARREGLAFLRPMELAWTATPSVVVIATSTASVVQTIRRGDDESDRHGSNALHTAMQQLCDTSKESVAEFGYVRGRAASSMVASWLEYAKTRYPEIVNDAWWQVWIASKLAEETRLGIGLQNDKTAPGRAVVVEIAPSSPAASLLQVGDVIVEAFGEPLSNRNAAQSLATHYERRGDRDAMPLVVFRDGRRMTVDIRVPRSPLRHPLKVKPITAMGRLTALLGGIETASYARMSTDPAHLDVRIRLRWADVDAKRPAQGE